jgi:hypothetical protein
LTTPSITDGSSVTQYQQQLITPSLTTRLTDESVEKIDYSATPIFDRDKFLRFLSDEPREAGYYYAINRWPPKFNWPDADQGTMPQPADVTGGMRSAASSTDIPSKNEPIAHPSRFIAVDALNSKAGSYHSNLESEQIASIDALFNEKGEGKRDFSSKTSRPSDSSSDFSEDTLLDSRDYLSPLHGLSPPAFRSALIVGMGHDFLALTLRKAKKTIDRLIYYTVNTGNLGSGMEASKKSGNASEELLNLANKKTKGKRTYGTFQRDRGNADEDEDSHSDDNNPRNSKKAKVSQECLSGLKFACHFYKHNHERYNSGACTGPGFQDIHRVK